MASNKHKLPEPVNQDENGFLYHYTSLDAFTKIIDNKTMFASHIKYLNDTSEQEIMKEIIRRRIAERKRAAKGEKAKLLDRQRRLLQNNANFFVTCFSEDRGDRLSQWRAYGGSSGVSLAFKKKELREFFEPSHESNFASLYQVRYALPEGDAKANRLVDDVLDAYDGNERDLEWFEIEALAAGATLKHVSFQEENEWRILQQQGQDKLQHRIRGSLLVPYVEVRFGEELKRLLAGVMVGPILHKEQTAEAIEGLLKSKGFTSTKVRRSHTPYRGF